MINEICFENCDFSNPDHLTSLAGLTNHYMADPMGGAEPHNKIRQLRLIDGLANHPTAEVVFAVHDGKVIGLATCFVNFSTFNLKPYLYIHDIVVLTEFRGQNVGRKLLEHLIKSSEERGFCKVTLEVREDNVVAQNLYKHLGFGETEPNMFFWTKKLV